jgi:ABC-type oligopeptide transport system substrate-binding subunit
MTAAKALAAFDEGEVEAVLGGRIEDLPRLDIAGLSRGAIRLDPVAGLFGLQVQHGDGLLGDPALREAVAMAIDREALVKAFNVGGWTATTRVVTPGLEGDTGTVGERWPGQPIDQRRAEAARRIARYRAWHQIAPLRIALTQGPGADQLFALLAGDLQKIGLEARQVGPAAPADLRLTDIVARYPRTAWFLDQLSCAAVRGLCDSAADALVARALAEPDAAAREDRLAEAEAAVTRANSFIPLAVPLRWSLVAGRVNGFAPNRWGVHPLMAFAVTPK